MMRWRFWSDAAPLLTCSTNIMSSRRFQLPRERLAARLDYNSLLRSPYVGYISRRVSGIGNNAGAGRGGAGRDSDTLTRLQYLLVTSHSPPP
jgi:hypothetical protein